ncbi:MAG: hypothetical protein ACLT1A_11140 [Dysosmobacter sp.]
MRKSVLLPAAAVAGGVVGLVVRRVYLANGFEAGTGLPIARGAQPVGDGDRDRRPCWVCSLL